jgi:hypothetical protein
MQSGRALGINQLAIPAHLEDSAARTNELDVGAWKLLLDSRLQLESPGSVPSGIAVFDTNVHAYLLVNAQATATRRYMQEVSPVDRPLALRKFRNFGVRRCTRQHENERGRCISNGLSFFRCPLSWRAAKDPLKQPIHLRQCRFRSSSSRACSERKQLRDPGGT